MRAELSWQNEESKSWSLWYSTRLGCKSTRCRNGIIIKLPGKKVQELEFKKRRKSHPLRIVHDNQGIRNGRVLSMRGSYSGCCCCSVAQSCPTLFDLMNGSMPGFPVLHYLSKLAQTHVHWVSDAIQPSHFLLPPFLPACNLSQHQGLFQWAGSSHQVAKVLELQLQHQSFQWISGLISFGIDCGCGVTERNLYK